MKGTATLVRVDGTEQVLDHKPSLKEAQGIVGGNIELVKVGHGRILVVNEESKINGKPINRRITIIFRSALLGGYITGDVIVLEGWRTIKD